MSEAPERIWVGTDGRDYHPVFLTENAAKEHGWNDADGADAPEYIRTDLVQSQIDAAVAAAYEDAAELFPEAWAAARQEIRARANTDALAERNARVRAEALRDAAEAVASAGYYCVPPYDETGDLSRQIDHSESAILALITDTDEGGE